MAAISFDVLVCGSAIVDFICYANRLPKPGETLHGTKFATGFGGKGANQCVAAARLGANAAILAKVGADQWGTDYINQLKKENVNTDFVRQCNEESTGIAQIAVSKEGENHIIIVPGANNLLTSKDVDYSEVLLRNSKVLLCQLETPVDVSLAALRAFKGISILNAAPAMESTPVELLREATILCVNETEAAVMAKCEDIKNLRQAKLAANKLVEMGSNTVIVTLGSQGAVFIEKREPDRCIHVNVEKVQNVVDTTGAGDAFLGALAFSLSKYGEKKLQQHISYANAVAAHSVQYSGTQSSFPYASDVIYEDKETNIQVL